MGHERNYGAARYGPKNVHDLPEDPVITKHAGTYARTLYLACTVTYNWGCTEFLAWQLHDDQRLGLHLCTGIYFPWQWLWWACTLLPVHYPSAAFTVQLRVTFMFTAAFAALCFAVSLRLVKYTYRRALLTADGPSDLRGSSCWATPKDVRASGARSHKK